MKQSFRLSVNLLAFYTLTGTANAATGTALPTSFEEMLAYVYTHNPQIAAEREQVAIADEKVSQAVAGYRPNLTANLGAGKQRQRIEDSNWQKGNATSTSLTATQPLFNGFGTLAQRRAADERVLAARARLLAVEQNALLTAINGWLDVCEKERILAIAQNNLHHMYQYDSATRKRFTAGDGTHTDVAQAESRLAQAESRLAQAQAERDSSRASFERTTGLLPSAIDFPPMPKTLPKDEATIIDQAQSNPELQQSSYLEKAAEQDIAAAESTLWPNVFLQASTSRENASAFGLNSLRNDSITLNVNIPLYQGGGEYSRVREAKLMREKSRFATIDIGRMIRERAKFSWNNFTAAGTMVDSSSRAVAASTRALKGVEEEQRQGLRNLTDVLDEQLQLLSTEISQTQAEKSFRLEAYRLLSVTGNLTAEGLNLPVNLYNPELHYKNVSTRWFGLDS